jgi:hypothetical protein
LKKERGKRDTHKVRGYDYKLSRELSTKLMTREEREGWIFQSK